MAVVVAALFVATGGCYFGVDGVDPWGKERDARLYPGPHPVVAHPPCARWCRLAGLVEKRWGHRRGDDGGCFESALRSVRTWGGVLEHPAWSAAWQEYGLPHPPRDRWQGGIDGGWVTQVSQRHYGHRAIKETWLYAFGVPDLPVLKRGRPPAAEAWLSWCHNNDRGQAVERMGKRERSATPLPFRDVLLSIARSARSASEAA